MDLGFVMAEFNNEESMKKNNKIGGLPITFVYLKAYGPHPLVEGVQETITCFIVLINSSAVSIACFA